MSLPSTRSTAHTTFDLICRWVLPLGFVLLLSGMFFLPSRGAYQKTFYVLISVPTLIALCLRPSELRKLLSEPIVVAFLLFGAWALVTLSWSHSPDPAGGRVKPVLYLFMLFAATHLLLRLRRELIDRVLLAAALLALLASAWDLYRFFSPHIPDSRMVGGGAFDNPLLSSHLFGFFCIYWFFMGMTVRNLKWLPAIAAAFVIMLAAVLATGSRTPLVALAMASLWLAVIHWNRRSLLVVAVMALAAVAIFTLVPQMIFERGNSFRFEIWAIALHLIGAAPWIGHGYGAPLAIDPGIGYSLSEPHNFALGVLFYVGIIGFLPWLTMQLVGLFNCWRLRAESLAILASTWMVFGIGASLTEGGGILYTPREHWFLLWIPLALMAALSIHAREQRARQPQRDQTVLSST